MKTILHVRTILYYDGPEIFEATDQIGGHYIAVAVPPAEGKERFIVIGVPENVIDDFCEGQADLRSVMLQFGQEEWFIATPSGALKDPLTLVAGEGNIAHSEMLPEDGFYLEENPSKSEVVREARSRGNLVLEVTLTPPEAIRGHRIHLDTLASVLSALSAVVKHSHSAVRRELTHSERKRSPRPTGPLLDVVVPATAGSFRVVLEGSAKVDLFGYGALSSAMERIDSLFLDATDEEGSALSIRSARGHLAGAYLRLLRILAEAKSGFKYTWADAGMSEARTCAITHLQAESAVELLSGISNLEEEQFEATGILEKADAGSGTWRFDCSGEQISGKTRDGKPSLEGMRIGGKYNFTWVEQVDFFDMLGRESRTLYLTEFSPIK